MTKQEFEELQLQVAESGQPLKNILPSMGIAYSTYNYWRKKFTQPEIPVEIAPIVVKPVPDYNGMPTMEMVGLPGVTQTMPNGVKAHFGHGSGEVLMEALRQSMSGHVLPQ